MARIVRNQSEQAPEPKDPEFRVEITDGYAWKYHLAVYDIRTGRKLTWMCYDYHWMKPWKVNKALKQARKAKAKETRRGVVQTWEV